jgi:hypothetical protein
LHHELLLAGASLAISFVNVIGFNVLVCWHACIVFFSFFHFFFFILILNILLLMSMHV